MPIQAIQPRRLYRQIADQIAGLIRRGEFEPGNRLLSDRQLAEMLRVSRPSVREALIALEIEGWVEVRAGSGIYVASRIPQSSGLTLTVDPGPFEILAARALIEPEMASLAAHNATALDVAQIGETLDLMEAELREHNSSLRGDALFHLRIAEATGNSAFIPVVKTLWDYRDSELYRKLDHFFDRRERHAAAVDEHRLVLEAIMDKDADAARAAMHTHLEAHRANLEASWTQASDKPAPKTSSRLRSSIKSKS